MQSIADAEMEIPQQQQQCQQSPAQRLFRAGLQHALSFASLDSLGRAAAACKAWHQAVQAMPACGLQVTCALAEDLTALIRPDDRPLRRHVSSVTVDRNVRVNENALVRLAQCMPHVRAMSFACDVVFESHTQLLPSALTQWDLACQNSDSLSVLLASTAHTPLLQSLSVSTHFFRSVDLAPLLSLRHLSSLKLTSASQEPCTPALVSFLASLPALRTLALWSMHDFLSGDLSPFLARPRGHSAIQKLDLSDLFLTDSTAFLPTLAKYFPAVSSATPPTVAVEEQSRGAADSGLTSIARRRAPPAVGQLHRLASEVAVYLAKNFLLDHETACWAHCNRDCLAMLRDYPIRKVANIEANPGKRAAKNEKLAPKDAAASGNSDDTASSSVAASASVGAVPSSSSLSTPASRRFGCVTHVTITAGPVRKLLRHLPPSVRSLKLEGVEVGPIDDGFALPQRLTSLDIEPLAESIDDLLLPATLTKLTLGFRFNRPFSKVRLPAALRWLQMGGGWNQGMEAMPPLSDALTTLVLGGMNQPIEQFAFPSKLQSLHFCDWRTGAGPFNQRVECAMFPDCLQHLQFGDSFNRSVEKMRVPSQLRILIFGDSFNRPVEQFQFPLRLESLSLGASFNRPLRGGNWNPTASLTLFSLGESWNQLGVDLWLPPSLRTLRMPLAFNSELTGIVWPDRLLSLAFSGRFNQPLLHAALPDSITELDLGDGFNQSMAGVRLPASLTRLTFGAMFRSPLLDWRPPSELRHIAFRAARYPSWSLARQSPPHMKWPEQLESLTLSVDVIPLSKIRWPDTLKHIRLQGNSFYAYIQTQPTSVWNDNLEGWNFPTNLERLTVEFILNGNWSRGCLVLPPNLVELELGDVFECDRADLDNKKNELADRMISPLKFPASLKILRVPPNCRVAISALKLPRKCRLVVREREHVAAEPPPPPPGTPSSISAPPGTPPSVPPPSSARLHRLPAAVAVHLAKSFLFDRETACWAHCNRDCLVMLKDYPIRKMARIDANPGKRAAKNEKLAPKDAAAANSDSGVASPSAPVVSAVPASSSLSTPASRRFGCVTHVTIIAGPVRKLLRHLPPSVRSLKLEGVESGPIDDGFVLPQRLTSLDIEPLAESIDDLLLPATLTKLTLGFRFNRPFSKVRLPAALRWLQMGGGWNQGMDAMPQLPDGLTTLVLGGMNQSIDGFVFPSKLKLLCFCDWLTGGGSFDQSLEAALLPDGLMHLRLGQGFDQPMTDSVRLPSQLRTLSLGDSFRHSLDDFRFPPLLERLSLGARFWRPLRHWTPNANLTELSLGDSWNGSGTDLRLPPSLRCFRIPHAFVGGQGGIIWPQQLLTLILPPSFNQPLSDELPASITDLDLGDGFNQSMEAVVLPASLTRLAFGSKFAASLQRWHPPPALRALEFRAIATHEQPPPMLWPARIDSLTLTLGHMGGWREPQQKYVWPATLTHMHVNGNSPYLRHWHLPSGLYSLCLNFIAAADYYRRIPPLALSPRLVELTLGPVFRRTPLARDDEALSVKARAAVQAMKFPPTLRVIHLPRDCRVWDNYMRTLTKNLRVVFVDPPSEGRDPNEPPPPPACAPAVPSRS